MARIFWSRRDFNTVTYFSHEPQNVSEIVTHVHPNGFPALLLTPKGVPDSSGRFPICQSPSGAENPASVPAEGLSLTCRSRFTHGQANVPVSRATGPRGAIVALRQSRPSHRLSMYLLTSTGTTGPVPTS